MVSNEKLHQLDPHEAVPRNLHLHQPILNWQPLPQNPNHPPNLLRHHCLLHLHRLVESVRWRREVELHHAVVVFLVLFEVVLVVDGVLQRRDPLVDRGRQVVAVLAKEFSKCGGGRVNVVARLIVVKS